MKICIDIDDIIELIKKGSITIQCDGYNLEIDMTNKEKREIIIV